MRALEIECSRVRVQGIASHARSACLDGRAGMLQPDARRTSTLIPVQFIVECRYSSWWRQNC